MVVKQRKYSDEFKIEAVKLVTDRGLSLADAGRDLGVAGSLIGRWKKMNEQGLLGDTVKHRDADGLRRLEKENRLLRQERDILRVPVRVKKAAAYFAKESL